MALSYKPLLLPPYQLLDGVECSPTTAGTCALWTTAALSWTGVPTVFRNDYPLAWTRESMEKLLVPFPDRQAQANVFSPSPPYGTTGTPIITPRAVIFLSFSLQSAIERAVSEMASELDQYNIHVIRGDDTLFGAFILGGMPPAEAEQLDAPANSNGIARIACTINPNLFLGGDVLVIAGDNYVGQDVYYYRELVGSVVQPYHVAWTESSNRDKVQSELGRPAFSRYHCAVINVLSSDVANDPELAPLVTTSESITSSLVGELPSEFYSYRSRYVPDATLFDEDAMAEEFHGLLEEIIRGFFGL